MSVNNRNGLNRVTAPFTRAMQAFKPKPAPTAAPQAAGDANQTQGAARYQAGVKAAKTGELSVLPFANTWWGALKNRFITTRVQTEDQKSTAFLERWKGKFSERGQAALERVANDTSPGGIKLRNQVNAFMKKGGNPEVAYAILKQVQAPSENIAQMTDMSCAAATAQKALARKDPAKYFRLMADLTGDGKAKFPGLGEIKVSQESMKDIKKADLGHSGRLNAMMQAALMEKFNGDANYDYSEDESVSKNKKGKETRKSGLNAEQAESLAETLVECNAVDPDYLGRRLAEAEKRGVKRQDFIRNNLVREMERADKEGNPGFFITINSKKGVSHMVLVRNLSVENGTITIEDAKGRIKTRSLDSFIGRVATQEGLDVGGGRIRVAAATTSGDV